MNKTIKHLSILIFSALLISCWNVKEEKRTSIDKFEAKLVAEAEIEALLKSPSTAKFSTLWDTKFDSIANGYRVIGHVDSQNSFGGMIRSRYSVEIYFDPSTEQIMYRELIVE